MCCSDKKKKCVVLLLGNHGGKKKRKVVLLGRDGGMKKPAAKKRGKGVIGISRYGEKVLYYAIGMRGQKISACIVARVGGSKYV